MAIGVENFVEGGPPFVYGLCECVVDGLFELLRGPERMWFDTDGNERISLKYTGIYSLDLFGALMKLILYGIYRGVYPGNNRNVTTAQFNSQFQNLTKEWTTKALLWSIRGPHSWHSVLCKS